MFWTPKTSGSVPPVLDDVAGIESAQAFWVGPKGHQLSSVPWCVHAAWKPAKMRGIFVT